MLLAIDTSTRYLGVALYDDSHVIGEITQLCSNHHTVELGPAVIKLLSRTELGVEGLKALAVALGPGSFTGLRIGLAFCKGLALSLNVPIVGVPTLDVLAYGQPVTDVNLVAVLEAGRGRIAAAWYRAVAGSWTITSPLENLTHENFLDRLKSPSTVCGEIPKELATLINEQFNNIQLTSPAFSLRRPAFLAELAWERWKMGKVDPPATLKPIYLHHGEPIPGG